MSSPWHKLDLSIVAISFLALLADIVPQLSTLKAFRILRVLRPLRFVSHIEGMKVVMASLARAIPAIVNVLGVVFGLHVIFAVLGMQLFMGGLGECSDPAILTKDACHRPLIHTHPDYSDDEPTHHLRALRGAAAGSLGAVDHRLTLWVHSTGLSFDNFFASMESLYVMSTGIVTTPLPSPHSALTDCLVRACR